ncbi:MAG: response regulator transcription factor [Dehalococcoidales bacterium]|nr:response regulator transcription factor [Dehalococcoidales bacterium]
MEEIRIVLAEDHALMREGTRRILEEYPDLKVVGEAEDGQRALDLIATLKPDVAILDIRMPKLNGVAVVRRMRELSPATKAVMLTAYDDDDYILALMEVGASSYLLKTTQADELVDAIRRVHMGEAVLGKDIAVKVAQLWARHRIMDGDNLSAELSPRERDVLEYAAKGLRNKDIADKLYMSVRTVEGHLSNIYTKLRVSSRTQAVLYAISQNLVSPEEEK